ncbi:MAG: phage holin family protein [Oscillospiraceae bacterium]|nr:phage holin family protein [Oscillospiraceae bacterium]
MADNHVETRSRNGANTVWQIVGRLIAATIILAITAFFTPGFHISGFWALATAAVVLTLMDYLIVKFTGLDASPFGKGFVGFILSVAILYAIQYFVVGYSISWIAAIIGALIYGVIAYFIPGDQSF